MIKDVTILTANEVDDYQCKSDINRFKVHSVEELCGNTSHSAGFEPCLIDGTVVEPILDGPWQGLYKCMDCASIHMILDNYDEDIEIGS